MRVIDEQNATAGNQAVIDQRTELGEALERDMRQPEAEEPAPC